MNININKEIERLDRHYRIFVSSTFKDLKDFRLSALQAILDLECVPLGMEMFPSNDEEQLSYIKRIIDKSDFYLILVGGRYGSKAKSGKSFTEEEFDYAKTNNKRIIALVLDGEKYDETLRDEDEDNQIAVIEFRKKVRTERIANSFKNADQLKYEISKSIREASKEDNVHLGLVSSKEVMNVITSFGDLDEVEKTQYFDALTHLKNLTTDELAWSYICSSFESLKQATHSLVYEGNANLHTAPLLNALISLQRFIEEIMYVPVRLSIKETEVSSGSIYVRTISDTSGGGRQKKKTKPISLYEGLSYLYRQILQGGSEEYWLCNNIPDSISSGSFGRGSFTKDQFLKLKADSKESPYQSTLCLPIYNIDMFDNERPIIRGFLCIDCKEKNQFQHEAIIMIASSFCSYLYIFMSTRNYFKQNSEKLAEIIFSKKVQGK